MVGIGTTQPETLLHVASGDVTIDSGQSIIFDGNSGDSNTYVQHTDGAQEKVEFYIDGTLVASISKK